MLETNEFSGLTLASSLDPHQRSAPDPLGGGGAYRPQTAKVNDLWSLHGTTSSLIQQAFFWGGGG